MLSRSGTLYARSSVLLTPAESVPLLVSPLRNENGVQRCLRQSSSWTTEPQPKALRWSEQEESQAEQHGDGSIQLPKSKTSKVRRESRRNTHDHVKIIWPEPISTVVKLGQALVGPELLDRSHVDYSLLTTTKLRDMQRRNQGLIRERDTRSPTDAEFKRWVLRRLNARVSDMLTNGERIHPALSLNAMAMAAECRSTAAILFHLRHLENAAPVDFARTLHTLRSWIKSDDFEGLNGPRNRTELLILLTGYPLGYPERTEEPHLPNILQSIGSPGHTGVGRDLAICVRELGSSRALLHLWDNHLEAWSAASGGRGIPEPSDLLPQSEVRSELQSKSSLPSSLPSTVIVELCKSSPPESTFAWKLAERSLAQGDDLSFAAWEHLLSSPELIDKHGGLRPHMEGTVKAVLEKWARQIEHELCVEWDPEAKTHVPRDADLQALFRESSAILSSEAPFPQGSDSEIAAEADSALDGEASEVPSLHERHVQDSLARRREKRLTNERWLRDEYQWIHPKRWKERSLPK